METEPPFAAVLIKGKAEIIIDGPDHWSQVRRITARYIAAEAVDAYIEPWSVLNAMCVIHPEKFVSWQRGLVTPRVARGPDCGQAAGD